MVCDAMASDMQVPTYWWNVAFPSSELYPEEGSRRFLHIVWVNLPNLMEPHPVTSSPYYISHA